MFNIRLRGSPCCLFTAAEINLEEERRGGWLALQCRSSNEEEEKNGGREGGAGSPAEAFFFFYSRGRFRDSLLVWKSSRRTRSRDTS